jgi:hypothetical protein
VRLAYLDLVEMLWTRLGLVSQTRKCKVYSPEGDVSAFPSSMAGANGGRQGVVVLGVPIGADEFVLQTIGRRMRELGLVACPSYAFSETRRCSIFSCGAAPTRVCPTSYEGFPPTSHDPERCSTTPPSWKGCRTSFQAPAVREGLRVVRLPIRMGGLGLTSAVRVSPAAYLGSWAQVMAPMAASSVHLPEIVDMAKRLPSARALHATYTDHVGPAVALLRESGRGCPPTPTRSLGGIHPLPPTLSL